MKDMTEEAFFFADTYALVEILNGSKAYASYADARLVTTLFNITELYYHLLRSHGVEAADTHLRALMSSTAPILEQTIQYGMKFRLIHRKEKLSRPIP